MSGACLGTCDSVRESNRVTDLSSFGISMEILRSGTDSVPLWTRRDWREPISASTPRCAEPSSRPGSIGKSHRHHGSQTLGERVKASQRARRLEVASYPLNGRAPPREPGEKETKANEKPSKAK